MSLRHKITPFLWYDSQAEEAANFYVSLFPGSRVTRVTRYPAGSPGPVGSAMTVQFELDRLPLTALNGGPIYRLTEAFSLSVDCESQDEIDHLWDQLSEGGSPGRCGWLKDRYGLSWQIVPNVLAQLLSGADTAGTQRAMQALLTMNKLDIQALQSAYSG